MNHRIKTALNRLQHFVYPKVCSICGLADLSHVGVCEQCLSVLPRCDNVCEVCGRPVEGSVSSLTCGLCQTRKPHYHRLQAPFWYEAAISELILQYKYHQHWQNAEVLIDLFCRSNIQPGQNSILIPMPSHPKRVRARGCNSVFELLRVLSRRRSISCDFNYLKRVKNTAIQADKSITERKRNIRDAFVTNHLIRHERVVLFDDVVTTGATVNEASRCLRKSGVENIEIWALARTKPVTSNY